MTSLDPELCQMDFVAEVLKPIKLVAWGELAMGYLGVRTGVFNYMLGVADSEMEVAREKLLRAGFQQQDWSAASTIDPETRKDDAIFYEIHTELGREFAQFDKYTMRFSYPDISKISNRTILIPLSYIYMSEPNSANMSIGKDYCTPQPIYYVNRWMYDCDNLYFPNAVVLLESFIRVILDHDSDQTLRNGSWRMLLNVWAMSYLYGLLNLRADVLDSCESEAVRESFGAWVKKSGPHTKVIKNGHERQFVTNDLIRDFQ